MPKGHLGITLYDKVCPICGKHFSVPAQKKRQLCCSKECGLKRMAESNKTHQIIHTVSKDDLVSAIEQSKSEDPEHGPFLYRVAELLGTSTYMVSRLQKKHGVYVSDYKEPVIRQDGYYGYTSDKNHRNVMESIVGRKLERNEIVHHIDGNRTNNDPSNLCLMTRSEHSALHRAELELIYGLLKKGIVGFDKDSKRYYITEGSWYPCDL